MKLHRRTEYALLGTIIREAREDLGLSQRALARKAGLAETAMSRIEAGSQRLDVVELWDLSRALRISMADLSARFEKAAGPGDKES